MKVTIKHVALLLCLFLATKAAPMGNEKEEGGENEGAEAGEQGETSEAGEMGDEGVTVSSPPPVDVTNVTLTNEEEDTTIFVTDAPTGQGAGASSSNVSGVAPFSPDKSATLDDFNYFDKNSDGLLDYKELFLGPNNFNPVNLNAAFQISDKNFDGFVDQREFFRHPLTWGRVIAEKQASAKDVDTSGTGTSENFTSPPDGTPAAEHTHTALPKGTSSHLPEVDVITTVPTAEQTNTGVTDVDQQSSVSVDTSRKATVSPNGKPDGKEPAATPKGQNEGVNGKSGSPVGSKEGGVSGSKIGHTPANGGQSAAGKEGASAGTTGKLAKMDTGKKDEKIPGDKTTGSQPSVVPGLPGGHHGQRGKDSQTYGQHGHAGSGGSHSATVSGKTVGHSMLDTRTNGIKSKDKVHTAGLPHKDVHSKTAQASFPSKPQEQPKQQLYHWDGHKWVKEYKISGHNGIGKSAGMASWPDHKIQKTHSEEEDGNESSNEEDKKSENENGKGHDEDDSDDKEENDRK